MAASFSCSCGAVTGTVADAAFSVGTHTYCRCADCRAACKHLTGRTYDYVDLLLANTHHFTYQSGTQHLRVLHMTPRGVHRVYAACCGSPMNTVATARGLAFASVYVDRLEDPSRVGKVKADIYQNLGNRTKHKGMARVVYGVASRAFAARMNGTWRGSPFFDAAGALTLPVDLISQQDKAAAYRQT